MSVELLIQHFGRVAEAPAAIGRVRDFVRELAVGGLLLGTRGSNWFDCTLGDLGKWGSGGTPNKGHPEYYDGHIPWIVIGDLNDGVVSSAASAISELGLTSSSAKVIEPGTVLIAMYGASIGKLGLAGIRCATNQAIAHCAVNPTLATPDYLMVALRSMRRELLARGQGGAQPNISQTILKAWPILLPPLAEQHRVVAKVNELMALCDQLEAAQKAREVRRDGLRAAALRSLASPGDRSTRYADLQFFLQNAPRLIREPAHVADVRFFLDRTPRLITKPEHVAAIRQTILELAVLGRLVPPDPVGDSASTKRWRPIREVLGLITDGDHATPPRIERNENAVPLVTAKNVRHGVMDFSFTDWVTRATAAKSWQRCHPARGDILMVCVGATIGRLCVLSDARDMVLVRSVALLRPNEKALADFLAHCLRSPMLQRQIWRGVKATGQPCLYLHRIQELSVPIPPLGEQQRIVAKVDQLMTLCDDLETALASARDWRSRLLEALLHEAFDLARNPDLLRAG